MLDDGVEVSRGASVGAGAGDVALVGLRAVVPEGARPGGGARYLEDNTTR